VILNCSVRDIVTLIWEGDLFLRFREDVGRSVMSCGTVVRVAVAHMDAFYYEFPTMSTVPTL